MLDEALPIIRSASEAARSRAPKSKPTGVVKAAHFPLNSVEDNFEYSGKRGDGIIGITLWLTELTRTDLEKLEGLAYQLLEALPTNSKMQDWHQRA